MAKFSKIIVVIIILTGYANDSVAENFIDYMSLHVSKSSISIDTFGATSVDEDANSYKLTFASNINEYLTAEYGFISLGEYKADYDITVGTFQFIESHTVNFKNSLFASVKLNSSQVNIKINKETISSAPDKFNVFFRGGALLWQVDLEMDGFMYDSGSPFGPYGATSNDMGISGFYGLGVEYKINEDFILSLNWELYVSVGKGAKLKYLDGTQKEYSGRNVESVGLGVSYLF